MRNYIFHFPFLQIAFVHMASNLLTCLLIIQSDKNSLNFTAMRLFMEHVRSSNSKMINECLFYFGVDSAGVNRQKRTATFVGRYIR